MSKRLLIAGGAGLLLWLALRRAAPPAGVPRMDDGALAAGAPAEDFWLTSGTGIRADRCDLPDDRHEAWSEEQRACVAAWHRTRAVMFHQQVYTPASRVSVREATTPEALALAVNFLANKLDRTRAPWTYGQTKAIDDFNDVGEWQFAQAFLPILGGLASAFGAKADTGRVSAAMNDAAAAFAADVARVADTAGSASALAINTGPTDDEGGLFDVSHSLDSWRIDGRGPSMDFGFDPLRFEGGDVYVRMRLLGTATGYGTWRFPFLSRELGYDNPELKTQQPHRVAAIARLWRTLDVLGALMKPIRQAVLVDGNVDPTKVEAVSVSDLNVMYRLPPEMPGLYAYRVGALELWGATLPPHPDDHATDLSGELGRTLAGGTYVPPRVDADVRAAETYVSRSPLADVGVTGAESTYVPPPSAGPTLATASTSTVPIAAYSDAGQVLLSKIGLSSRRS